MQDEQRTDTGGTPTPGLAGSDERLRGSSTGGLAGHWSEVLEGVVEDGRERRGAALVPPARGRRRWPWSLGAAVAGAAAGAAVVLAVRRVLGQDAPDAQEPEQLRAVVDSGPALAPPAGTENGAPPQR